MKMLSWICKITRSNTWKMLHRTLGDIHSNTRKYSLDYLESELGCINTINRMHEKYTRGCVKLLNRTHENTQSNTWKYSIERMKAHTRIYEIPTWTYKNIHTNTWKYSIGCMKIFIRMRENTHLATWSTDMDVWTQFIECMKVHSLLCKLTQPDIRHKHLNVWKYSIECTNYSLEYMTLLTRVYETISRIHGSMLSNA